MSLTLPEVERIARLARLALNEHEAAATLHHLNGILTFVEQLQAVDTEAIEPMTHAVDMGARLRSDVVSESDRRAAFQALAPETEAGLYLVPQVIEQG